MLCFETIDADVAIAPKMAAAKYELKLLPADQLKALATAPPPQPTAPKPALQAATEKKPEAGNDTGGNAEAARRCESAKLRWIPCKRQRQQCRHLSVLVESGFRQSPLQHQKPLQRRLRRHSRQLSARTHGHTPSADLQLQSPLTIASPSASRWVGRSRFRILLPRGPNFFVGYQWTRNNTAQTNSALVPTLDERAGIVDGTTFPVSPQAACAAATLSTAQHHR